MKTNYFENKVLNKKKIDKTWVASQKALVLGH